MKYELSNRESNINELITTKHTNTQLNDISILDLTLEELDNAYPIQCLRQEAETLYVVYKSQNAVLLIFFDLNGSKLFGRVFLTEKSYKEFLIEISYNDENQL